jgi:signal peptidase I
VKGFTRLVVWSAAILGAIGLLLYLLVFDVWQVTGGDPQLAASILPTLMPQDKVLVQRGRTPRWGELARCASPMTTGAFVVGRVFGTPGDRVEVSDGSIVTNGRPLAPRHGCPQRFVAHPVTENLVTMTCNVAETGSWSFEYLTGSDLSMGTHSALVEAGKLYLVSDNRLMHQDSRDFGQIDASTCEHVVFRLWGEHYTDSSRRFTILW